MAPISKNILYFYLLHQKGLNEQPNIPKSLPTYRKQAFLNTAIFYFNSLILKQFL